MENRKKEKQQIIKSMDDFEVDAHLWNIIPPKGNSLILLKKIVDAIHWGGLCKMPSVLITGKEGKRFHAKAFINSLAIEDVREIPASYFDHWSNSKSFFNDSLSTTAHLITDLEQLKSTAEYTLWRYLKVGSCNYNFANNEEVIIHCNGLIVLTASSLERVPTSIKEAVDYKIELEPYTSQLELIVLQRLHYCKIIFDDEKVLGKIVAAGQGSLKEIMRILRNCITIVLADSRNILTTKDVDIAIKIS